MQGLTETTQPERMTTALPHLTTLLTGFSQGAIMVLHVAAAGLPLAGGITIPGGLVGPVPRRTDWSPITLIDGDQGRLMAPEVARATAG